MAKGKTNFLTPIKGTDYIAPDQIQEEYRDKWRKASWSSKDGALALDRQLEYLEQLQSLLIHGSKSEKDF